MISQQALFNGSALMYAPRLYFGLRMRVCVCAPGKFLLRNQQDGNYSPFSWWC